MPKYTHAGAATPALAHSHRGREDPGWGGGGRLAFRSAGTTTVAACDYNRRRSMPVIPGMRIGPYEILSPLGEGGMGQVWRARDSRLPREVAVKVLPDSVTANPDRLARFARESEILARLSHSHIAVIHGVEEGPFGRAIVMELVAGAGLDERLARGPLPIADALAIGRDVADALESAHEHGIVHRDLKPANLKLGSDGRVKVLDFGLARADDGNPAVQGLSHSPTVIGATQAGTLLGTAAYMSPEQARGEPVDRRADVWAFGCVLFEMLTGRGAFRGRTAVDVLGAIIGSDPDLGALPDQTPPPVRRLIERCLRKDARSRLRDMGDARVVLEDVLAGRYDAAVPPPRRTSAVQVHAVWTAVALASAALAAWSTYRVTAPDAVVPARTLEITVTDPVVSGATRPQLAPDGGAVVYGAGDRLWIRRLDQADAREVPGSQLAERPIWSPDGSELAFAARGRLWKVAVNQGAAVPICELPGWGRIIAGAWRPDGVIVFSSWFGPLYQVPASGGDPAVFHEDPGVIDFHEISLLPDGRTLVMVPHTAVANLSEVVALRDGRRHTILQAPSLSQVDTPRYSPEGYLLFARQDAGEGIWAVRFDPGRLELHGEPFRIIAGSWAFDVATGNVLVYTTPTSPQQLVWLDRGGTRLGTIGAPQLVMATPALSPDGRSVAVSVAESAFTTQNLRKIGLIDVVSGALERLPVAPGPSDEEGPEWSADGSQLVYVDSRQRPMLLRWRRVGDGSLPRALTPGSGRASFSADGRTLAFARVGGATGADIWMATLGIEGTIDGETPLVEGAGNQRSPRFSPDGRFLAYESDESGRPEIYVRRSAPTSERWLVSRDGGGYPIWSRSSHELFYRARDGGMMAVPVAPGEAFRAGEPRRLFEESSTASTLSRAFDVSPDGQRFLAVRRASGVTARIVVVQNWLGDFAR